MSRILVAVDGVAAGDIARAIEQLGEVPVGIVAAVAPATAADEPRQGEPGAGVLEALGASDTLLLHLRRDTINAALVALCDARGIRIVALCEGVDDERLAELYGLTIVLALDSEPRRIARALTTEASGDPVAFRPRRAVAPAGRVIAVWGPAGAPGRSTVAIELAVLAAHDGRRAALIDADTHAPSLALALGLADEGPGFAAACRHAERGTLSPAELTRISTPLGRGVDVLTGLNRPGRWPELSESRVAGVLALCRTWTDDIIVDVAAPLERDEEIMSDLAAPRRNGATLAALRSADLVVAVAAADPVGISRFVRAYADLRATIGATPILVVVNRLRPGAVGIDARSQVRATLERFCGIRDIWFLPQDARAADAGMLAARPVQEVAGRSALSVAMRRFVGEAIAPPEAPEPVAQSRRRRARGPGRAARTAAGSASRAN